MRVHAEGRAPDAHLVLSMDNDVATRAWDPHDDVDPQSCSDKTHDIEFFVRSAKRVGGRRRSKLEKLARLLMSSLRSNPALRARCPIKRRRVRLPFGAAHCCLKTATELARPAVTWSTSTSATRALRRRMCALGCSYLVACASR